MHHQPYNPNFPIPGYNIPHMPMQPPIVAPAPTQTVQHDHKTSYPQLMELNTHLWERVHNLEFKVLEQLNGKKRDQKLFAKNLVRMAKYLADKQWSADKIRDMLTKPGKVEEEKGVEQWSGNSEEESYSSGNELSDDAKKLITQKKPSKKPKTKNSGAVDTESDSDFDQPHPSLLPPNAPSSAKTIEQSTSDPTLSKLSSHMSIPCLAGQIPPSLLVNIDFKRFANMNGFE